MKSATEQPGTGSNSPTSPNIILIGLGLATLAASGIVVKGQYFETSRVATVWFGIIALIGFTSICTVVLILPTKTEGQAHRRVATTSLTIFAITFSFLTNGVAGLLPHQLAWLLVSLVVIADIIRDPKGRTVFPLWLLAFAAFSFGLEHFTGAGNKGVFDCAIVTLMLFGGWHIASTFSGDRGLEQFLGLVSVAYWSMTIIAIPLAIAHVRIGAFNPGIVQLPWTGGVGGNYLGYGFITGQGGKILSLIVCTYHATKAKTSKSILHIVGALTSLLIAVFEYGRLPFVGGLLALVVIISTNRKTKFWVFALVGIVGSLTTVNLGSGSSGLIRLRLDTDSWDSGHAVLWNQHLALFSDHIWTGVTGSPSQEEILSSARSYIFQVNSSLQLNQAQLLARGSRGEGGWTSLLASRGVLAGAIICSLLAVSLLCCRRARGTGTNWILARALLPATFVWYVTDLRIGVGYTFTDSVVLIFTLIAVRFTLSQRTPPTLAVSPPNAPARTTLALRTSHTAEPTAPLRYNKNSDASLIIPHRPTAGNSATNHRSGRWFDCNVIEKENQRRLKNDTRKTFRKNVLIASSGNILLPLAYLISYPLIARALGVHGRGDVAAATAPVLFAAAVGAFGMPEAIVFVVARRIAGPHTAMRMATLVTTASGPLLSLAIFLLSRELSGGEAKLARYISLAGIAVTTSMLVVVARSIAMALQKWHLFRLEQLISATYIVISVVACFVMGRLRLSNAVFFLASAPTVGGLAYLRVLPRRDLDDAPAKLRVLFSYGIRNWVGSTFGFAVSRLDQALLTPLSNAYNLGIYAVSVNISEIPIIFSSAFTALTLTSDAAERDDERVTSSARASFVVCSVLSLTIGLFLPVIIGTVFGAEFMAAIFPTIILSFGIIIGAPGSVAGAALSARGRPGLRSSGLVIAAIVNVGLLLILVPGYGAVGAALATLVTNVCAAAWAIYHVQRLFGLSANTFYGFRRTDVSRIRSLMSARLSAQREPRRQANSLSNGPTL